MSIDVNAYVQQALEELDLESIVKECVSNLIRLDVSVKLKEIVQDEAQELIRAEIENNMAGPVSTDDGWGSKKIYPSFEELFKTTIKEKLDKEWEMKRMLENAVRAHTNKYIEDNVRELTKEVSKVVLSGAQQQITDVLKKN